MIRCTKYYVTFPLTALPPGKVVVSATLTLHQFGNSQPDAAKPSLVQVLTVERIGTRERLRGTMPRWL